MGEEEELSLEDLQEMIDEGEEIDLDDLIADVSEEALEKAEDSEREDHCNEYADAMRTALAQEQYHKAWLEARELGKLSYPEYRDEIESCYKECADHGVEPALIHMMEKGISREHNKVKEDAFPYIKELSGRGYIPGFRWLADCYYYGIGCEKDMKSAEKLYFEGMLFDDDDYCREKYRYFHPEPAEFDGGGLIKELVRDMVYTSSDYARLRIGELILEGQISEYAPASAYSLLKPRRSEYASIYKLSWLDFRKYDDGFYFSLLGECMLRGIGTDADPVVALQIFELALEDLEWIVTDPKDEYAKEAIEKTYHEEKDFVEALDRTKRLIQEAKDQIREQGEYNIMTEHNGVVDPEEIFKEWEKEVPLYIKRAAG